VDRVTTNAIGAVDCYTRFVRSDGRRRPHRPRRTLPDGTRRWEGPTCVRLRPATSISTRCASGHCGSPCAVKP